MSKLPDLIVYYAPQIFIFLIGMVVGLTAESAIHRRKHNRKWRIYQ